MRRRKGRLGVLVIIVILLNTLLAAATVTTTQEEAAAATTTVTKVKVGVVLDLNIVVGKMGLSCISMALADFYSSSSRSQYYKTRVILNTIDSNATVVDAAAAALDLIKVEEVQAIIGPTSSMQANFMIDVGEKSQVPIISYSATRPSLTSHRNSFFFRVAQNDSSQVKAIGAVVKAFKWRQVIPIYSDNEFGDGIIPYLIDALQQVDADVPYQSIVSPSATDAQITEELRKLMKMQTRVFVVHMLTRHASRFFTKVKEIGMMKRGYVWIITDAIANELDLIEPSAFKAMEGVVGIRTYVPRTKRLKAFTHEWQNRFRRYFPTIEEEDIPELDVFGLWAYDAAWALAMAVEKAGTDNLRYSPTNVTATEVKSSNYLFNLGVNENGPKLRDAFSNVTFRGLAGEFSLINGQLQPSLFEIVNLVDNGRRNVGFWSPETGLTRKLQDTARSKGLRSIIWPGEPIVNPKGWEIPIKGKKLRVGVPVKDGFWEFVNVVRDPNTNQTEVTGYCIDVFKEVIKELPYLIDYEFIPANQSTSLPGGSYNDLTYQLFLGKFDAVVGDITIRANRSLYIDYTLPFAESGVAMIVPMKNIKKTNAWSFLKPLTWKLWLTTGFFFIFIAIVVWILEHRLNEDFRGPPLDQICISLWYSFSTMVFAHREVTLNNWTRLVVIVWLFVVLIITQSYTASLASLLTVQELKPTVTDINQLLKNGEKIGYQGGSFVYGILKSLKFVDSQLKTYKSAEEMHQFFTNGEISAAVDETPYIKIFLAKYCSQYTTTEPTYKADGFGFGFPIGSPLVPDISRKILEVTENENTTRDLENKWFKNVSECTASKVAELSSTRLSIGSFWGLFMITGLVSLSSVVVYVAKFVYDEQPLWQNAEHSRWKRFKNLVRKFMSRDQRAHPLRRRVFINGVPVNPEEVVVRDDDHPRRD